MSHNLYVCGRVSAHMRACAHVCVRVCVCACVCGPSLMAGGVRGAFILIGESFKI